MKNVGLANKNEERIWEDHGPSKKSGQTRRSTAQSQGAPTGRGLISIGKMEPQGFTARSAVNRWCGVLESAHIAEIDKPFGSATSVVLPFYLFKKVIVI